MQGKRDLAVRPTRGPALTSRAAERTSLPTGLQRGTKAFGETAATNIAAEHKIALAVWKSTKCSSHP